MGYYADDLKTCVEDEIRRIEDAIRRSHPDAKFIEIEPSSGRQQRQMLHGERMRSMDSGAEYPFSWPPGSSASSNSSGEEDSVSRRSVNSKNTNPRRFIEDDDRTPSSW